MTKEATFCQSDGAVSTVADLLNRGNDKAATKILNECGPYRQDADIGVKYARKEIQDGRSFEEKAAGSDDLVAARKLVDTNFWKSVMAEQAKSSEQHLCTLVLTEDKDNKNLASGYQTECK